MRTWLRKRRPRRGMTIVLVLGLLSITLALSYAMLRTQVTSALIQKNATSRSDARQAAATGMQVALRRMHEANWAGVDAPISGSLGGGASYNVTFATGDAILTVAHPDYVKYPYRVTLTSTGTAIGTDGASAATHVTQAVVELVPRALSSQPAGWAALTSRTVHQWNNASVVVQPPLRIEGPAHLQGGLSLFPDYPPDERPWDGQIDEVGVFNRALTAVEIADLATVAGTSPNVQLPINYASLLPSYWWRLNESSGATAAAAAAGSISGAFTNGAASGATGLSGQAADFDGFNDYIATSNFSVSGDKLTLLAFIRADSWGTSTYPRIISKAIGANEEDTYWMLSAVQTGGNMRLRFRVRAGGSTKTLIASSGNLSTGIWYMATAVYDGTNMILYLNGSEVGRTTKSGSLATSSATPVFIGDCPPGSARTRYARDLEAMRVAGLGDSRPFSGPIELPRSRSSTHTLSLLEGELATATTNVTATSTAPLSHPGVVSSYRLYPGGKTYNTVVLAQETQSTSLAPDINTNPLGIFRRSGRLNLGAGVSVQGTIITSGTSPDICIEGAGVQLAAVPLPALYGTTPPIELPVALSADDIHVRPHAGTSIRGYVMAGDEFTWDEGSGSATCLLEGSLLCGRLSLYGRTNWEAISAYSWESWLTDFLNQLGGSNAVPHYPTWVDDEHGYCYDPLLTIRPATSAVRYHWPDWSQPIFVPHASDAGLVWKIIRWADDR